MPKSKTYFPQVPVEIAERVAKAESNGHATEALKQPKKKNSSRDAPADSKLDEEESERV